jgi:prepilin-type N-terminal cleavage/methylation domain-containing protein
MKISQHGFSLAELLVTLAISGVLLGVIVTALFQMTTISSAGDDQLTVWHQLQNVNHQLGIDCQEALTASGSSSLTLNYTGGGTVTYSLTGTSLRRTSGTNINTLAQDIASLSFSVTGRLVTMNITSTVSGRTGSSEQITSLVNLRPTSP